ncbi:unnamed protein product [Cercospora beticola]|nr:unnamed protein product [Cercospora beticola]
MSFSNTNTGSQDADPYTSKNQQEPSLQEKVEDLKTFIDKNKFCLLTTKNTEGLLVSRAMALAAKVRSVSLVQFAAPRTAETDPHKQEGNGIDLIFHTNTESGKTDDLDANAQINVGFLNNSGEWASFSGPATVETDRAKVREYYSPALKAWLGDLGDGKHDGGPEDPRIGLIKIKTSTVTYATSAKNFVTSTIEVVKGAVTGETPSVNKLRHLSEQEVQQWRSSS